MLYYDHICVGVRLYHAHIYSLFKWHQLFKSHTLPSLFLSSFSISLFLPLFLLICNLQFKYISQNTALVCAPWLYDRVFVGLIAGPHLNLHAHGHCWGRNEPHSCHALSFMTKTHRFPSPLRFPPSFTPSDSTQISFSLV